MIFTIDAENNISAFATREEAAAATTNPFESFVNQKELTKLAGAWPPERLIAIWNSLPGVTEAKSFKNATAAAGKIWGHIQGIAEAAKPEPEARPKAAKKAKGGAKAAKGASAKGKSGKKATAAKRTPSAKRAAKTESAGPREGSKTAQVVAMLQRKSGATITEIMETMGWQKHTVRGFMPRRSRQPGKNRSPFVRSSALGIASST